MRRVAAVTAGLCLAVLCAAGLPGSPASLAETQLAPSEIWQSLVPAKRPDGLSGRDLAGLGDGGDWSAVLPPEPRPSAGRSDADQPAEETAALAGAWAELRPEPRPADLLAAVGIGAETGSAGSAGSLVPLAPHAPRSLPPMPAGEAPTLRQMVGQMLLLGFTGTRAGDPGVETVARYLRAGLLGGVLIMRHNVESKAQLAALVAHLRQSAHPRVPLIAADQEGGKVQRLGRRAGFQPIPSAARLARRGPAAAAARYYQMAAELAEVGVNLNLGPVVDLDINPRNPVIGSKDRSYGAEPESVGAFAAAFIDAHRAQRIATAAKHFPGHGSSRTDTHKTFTDVTGSWQPSELAPYRALEATGRLDAVMVAHVALAPVTGGTDRPASLSAEAIEGHLRGMLGDAVVVMTDDLEMAAVRKRHSIEESAVRAVKAGNDLLIFSNTWRHDPQRADRLIEAILGEMAAGRISRERIRASYARLAALRSGIR